jgi:cytochrome c peroxidase
VGTFSKLAFLWVLTCVVLAGVAVEAPAESDPETFRWELPPGFPEPQVPLDNPMTEPKVELGRRLFYDTRLSGTGTFSCATCHRQELAFTDGRPRAVGETDESHARGSMSLANAAYNASLTWADPTLDSLEQQALVPMLNEHPVELGIKGREDEILVRLQGDPRYLALFRASFPHEDDRFTLENVAKAIASFERTLISGDSAYNRLVWRDESDALSDSARRGMRLFFSEKTRCSECHAGFTLSGPARFVGDGDVRPAFHNTGLYDVDGSGSYPERDRGLYDVTRRPEDMGRFRAPTLYNVSVTAPYMHDGSVETLKDVMIHYNNGGVTDVGDPVNDFLSGGIRPLDLDEDQIDDLVAFMEALTSPEFEQSAEEAGGQKGGSRD